MAESNLKQEWTRHLHDEHGGCESSLKLLDGFDDPNEAWKACNDADDLDWILVALGFIGWREGVVWSDLYIRSGGREDEITVSELKELYPDFPLA